MGESSTPIAPLALRPRDAAKALALSERTLWSLTAPRGPIPVVRVGTARLYRLADLDAWLAARAGTTRTTGQEGGTP